MKHLTDNQTQVIFEAPSDAEVEAMALATWNAYCKRVESVGAKELPGGWGLFDSPQPETKPDSEGFTGDSDRPPVFDDFNHQMEEIKQLVVRADSGRPPMHTVHRHHSHAPEPLVIEISPDAIQKQSASILAKYEGQSLTPELLESILEDFCSLGMESPTDG